jgi:hypothetical protein
MQRHRYAPLVVDRFHRPAYVGALDGANDGNLNPLVQLFANLESSALASELEQPEIIEATTSRQVARTLAAQLAARRAKDHDRQRTALEVRAKIAYEGLQHWFEGKREELLGVFEQQGIDDASVDVLEARSDEPTRKGTIYRHLFFRSQVIESAHMAGHHADFTGFVALHNLRIRVEGTTMSFLASVHGAGGDSGVLAVTTFAVIRQGNPDFESPNIVNIPTTVDAFRVVYSETVEAINGRLCELYELLDQGLTVALAELLKRI